MQQGLEKHEKVAACINETEYPQIRFHKTCRSMLTMKWDLEKLQKEDNKPKEKINVTGMVFEHPVLVVMW